MVNHPEDTSLHIKESGHLDEAERIGAGLQQVRERLGWKLTDVAERIKIRAALLTAIESGDLSSLPGTAYRVGFVRSYAQTLGLDGEEILQRFRNAGQIGEPEKNEIKLLAPVPNRGVPKGAVIFIAFVIAIGGYGLWYHHTEQTRKLAQNALQIPTKLQPLTAPPKVTPPAAQAPAAPSSTASTPAAPASSTLQAVATATSPSPTAATNTAAPANMAATSPAAPPAATPATSANAPDQGSATTAVPTSPTAATPTPVGLVITATQPAWVQVTAPNGTILFSKVLNAGQSWPVPQMPGLKMTTGNAGGTVITNNGKAGQPLGAIGVVLRGYQLTPTAQNSAASTPSSTDDASAP